MNENNSFPLGKWLLAFTVTFIFLGLAYVTFTSSGRRWDAVGEATELGVRTPYFYSGASIYFLGPQTLETADVHQAVKKWLPGFVYFESLPDSGVTAGYIVMRDSFSIEKPAVHPAVMEYVGQNLTLNELDLLPAVRRGISVAFFGESANTLTKQHRIPQLLYRLTHGKGVVVWDGSTGECFNPTSWKEKRIDNFDSVGYADVTSQITIHTYPEENALCRAVTMGLNKFSLPEISVTGFSCNDQMAFGYLVNAVAQSLFEYPFLNRDTTLILRLADIRNEAVRRQLQRIVPGEARGAATVFLHFVEPQEGDNPVAQLAIEFKDAADSSLREAQYALISSLFGMEAAVSRVEHTAAALAASERAKQKLPGLRDLFNSHKNEGYTIFVKAPFAYDDINNEWMWVEVTKWEDTDITGILQNDPSMVADLKAGAQVRIKQGDVFDYLLTKPDGTSEGNETETILRQQQ